MNYTLKVRYKDKRDFYFYSPCFVAANLTEAIAVGKQILKQEWEKISPHEPPDELVDVLPGVMGVVSEPS